MSRRTEDERQSRLYCTYSSGAEKNGFFFHVYSSAQNAVEASAYRGQGTGLCNVIDEFTDGL